MDPRQMALIAAASPVAVVDNAKPVQPIVLPSIAEIRNIDHANPAKVVNPFNFDFGAVKIHNDLITDRIGVTKFESPLPLGRTAGSEDSLEHVENFVPRKSDVFITTPPKSGTTMLQQICHQLRTGGDMDFEDIHQVVPSFHRALDVGIDVNEEQRANPRLFKAHARLSCLPRGGKYIITARDPENMALSAYEFYSAGNPGQFGATADEFVRNRFNPLIFDIVAEGYLCRDLPNVLFLTYDQLVNSTAECVKRIGKLLDVNVTPKLLADVIHLSSRETMLQYVSKFDNSWTNAQVAMITGQKKRHSAPKVTSGKKTSRLNEESKAILQKLWEERVGKLTGCPTYEAMLQQCALDEQEAVARIERDNRRSRL